jgi:hypothetical protein
MWSFSGFGVMTKYGNSKKTVAGYRYAKDAFRGFWHHPESVATNSVASQDNSSYPHTGKNHGSEVSPRFLTEVSSRRSG